MPERIENTPSTNVKDPSPSKQSDEEFVAVMPEIMPDDEPKSHRFKRDASQPTLRKSNRDASTPDLTKKAENIRYLA